MVAMILSVVFVVALYGGFVYGSIHNPAKGGAYDKLKDYMGWKD